MKTYNFKQAILVGGEGFIGTNLNNYLKKKKIKTYVITKNKNPKKNQIYFKNSLKIKKISKRKSYIFYLVGRSLPSSDFLNFEKDLNHEIKTLLTYLKIFSNSRSKWIFVSSGGTVYGNTNVKNKENFFDLKPISYYGLIKLLSEKIFHFFYNLNKINFSIVRLSNPYGPGQLNNKNHGFIINLLNAHLKKKKFNLHGNKKVIRDFIFIDDACDGIYKVAKYGKNLETYNIGFSKGYSLENIIERSKKLFKNYLKIDYKRKSNLFDVNQNILDISKAKKELKFRPYIGIEQGLKKTYKYLKSLN